MASDRRRHDMPEKHRRRHPAALKNSNGGRHRCRPPLSLRRILAWEARRPARGGFESAAPGTGGSQRRFLRGPRLAEAGRSFPAGSPTGPKPWRFAARRIRNFHPRSHPFGMLAETSIPERTGSSAEASVPPDGPWTEALGPAGSQLPGRSPVLPENPEPKPLLPGGDALTEVPLSAGRILNPKVRCPACSIPTCPKAA
jgi:hypothetical protein